MPTGYADIIAKEAATLVPIRQLEVLDFIGYLKNRQNLSDGAAGELTPEAVRMFLSSFKVDLSQYRFNRDDANAR